MTHPFLWLLVGGTFLGLGLAWVTRWKPRSRRVRGWLVPWGLNFAVAAFLVAVLVSGTGPSGLAAIPLLWGELFGLATLASLLVFRFPRAVGLPVLAAVVFAGWYLSVELKGFQPLESPARAAEVRLLTETDQMRRFEVRLVSGAGLFASAEQEVRASEWPLARVEVLELPVWVPWPVHRFVRFAEPAVTPGWGFNLVPSVWKSPVLAPPPVPAERMVLYRLDLAPGAGVWVPVASALQP